MSQRFSTALRTPLREKIETLNSADIVIGIPSFQSGSSIIHVLKTVAEGLGKYYPGTKALILVSDGGSTDDTREFAEQVEINSFSIEKMVTIYRGVPGKGSGLRAIFEATTFLRADALAVFDSDLVSITPEWVRNLLNPLADGYDLVCPHYQRFKLDGTITNTIAYNLTRALYGQRVRQPIGGDFGVSRRLAKHYLDQDVWETDVAKFGIDIYMTASAMVGGFSICQARLGTKIHGHKDPAGDLGPMFQQVVGTIFTLMDLHHSYWQHIDGSHEVPLIGNEVPLAPPAFEIDRESLVDYFRMGYGNFQGVWKNILEPEDYDTYRRLVAVDSADSLLLPLETWVRTVYRYAAAFRVTPRQRIKLLSTMIPLYHARVASLINELADKNDGEAEAFFETQAKAFEEKKDYLRNIWGQGGSYV